jgi:hypothetical protein
MMDKFLACFSKIEQTFGAIIASPLPGAISRRAARVHFGG